LSGPEKSAGFVILEYRSHGLVLRTWAQKGGDGSADGNGRPRAWAIADSGFDGGHGVDPGR
jgi:hypothetical protein